MTAKPKSKDIVDQIYVRGRGWSAIKPMPWGRLWKKRPLVAGVVAVHFVDHGDYNVPELRGGK